MRNKLIFAAIVMAIAAIGCQNQKPASVLLITVDSLKSDDLTGPNLLKLKKRGLSFTQAFSPTPATLPAIATILTGLHPIGHGVLANENYELGQEAITLGEVFETNHFRTCAEIGSSSLGPDTGVQQGFDAFGFLVGSIPAGAVPTVVSRPAKELVNDASKWIKAFGEKPFFMLVHLADLETARGDRAKALADIDDAVGKLLAIFPGKGRSTIVVLVATAAPSLGAHGEEGHGIFLYDTTTRVPLIFAGPGITSGESNIGVSLEDILPTVTSFLGFPMPKTLQGLDMSPALRGGKPTVTRSEFVLTTQEPYDLWGWSSLLALRTENYKYIRAPKPELYDLKLDSQELKNLAAEKADILKQMDGQLADIEKRLKLEKAPGKREHPIPAVSATLPDPKERIKVVATILEGARALDLKDNQKALALLDQARTMDPDNSKIPFLSGQALVAVGQPAKAIPFFEEAAKKNPNDPITLVSLGETYMAAGEDQKAIKTFEDAVKLARMPLVYVNLGYLYSKISANLTGEERIKALQQSLSSFGIALRSGEESAGIYYNIAAVSLELAYAVEQNPEPAAKQPEKNGQAMPTRKQYLDTAYTFLKATIEKDPKMADAYFELGQLIIKNYMTPKGPAIAINKEDTKKAEEARGYLQKFLELAPSGPKADTARKLLKELGK